jgi:polyisoprenoid-binding protein YceI
MKKLILRSVELKNFFLLVLFLLLSVARAQTPAAVPVFEITPADSKITFDVQSSIDIKGTFDKWKATLTFTSTDVMTGILEIEIQAASVNTGSGAKNSTIKGKDFFDAKRNPLISFKSTKFVETGPNTFEVDGNFTIRGVTKPEKLTFTASGRGASAGTIVGTMDFDRKNYGMNGSVPLVRIANRVDVVVNLKGKRSSGPPLDLP